jgi:hypothetical protein
MSYFEGLFRFFFEIAIPDPWSSFLVASYDELTGISIALHKITPGAQELHQSVWRIQFAQKPFNESLSLSQYLSAYFVQCG